jgi:HSP20 family protein
MSTLIRWNPVRELLTLREAMDQAFNALPFRSMDPFGRPTPLPIDAYMTDEALVLIADVPGLKPEDLSVTLEGDTVTIRGEIKPAAEKGSYLLRERLFGRFERTLTVNTPIEPNNVEATFENGVLTLTLPRAAEVRPRQITVKASNGGHNQN